MGKTLPGSEKHRLKNRCGLGSCNWLWSKLTCLPCELGLNKGQCQHIQPNPAWSIISVIFHKAQMLKAWLLSWWCYWEGSEQSLWGEPSWRQWSFWGAVHQWFYPELTPPSPSRAHSPWLNFLPQGPTPQNFPHHPPTFSASQAEQPLNTRAFGKHCRMMVQRSGQGSFRSVWGSVEGWKIHCWLMVLLPGNSLDFL